MSWPAVSMYCCVPMGAPPMMVALIPSCLAYLAIRPDSTSSAPMNRASGFCCRIDVSAALKSF